MNLLKFVDNNIVCFMSAAAAIAMSNRFTATHKEQEKNPPNLFSQTHFGCCSCHMGAV